MSDHPFSSVTDLLFVYGTLKRGSRNAFAGHLQVNSTYIVDGWFSGRLYQVDWYPGAIYDPSAPTRVWGEVYQMHQPATTLSILDGYEGVDTDLPLFTRRAIPVYLNDRIVVCQAYLYSQPTANLMPIDSGWFPLSD